MGRDNLSKCYRHQYNAMNFGTQLTFGPCNVNLYTFGSVQFYVIVCPTTRKVFKKDSATLHEISKRYDDIIFLITNFIQKYIKIKM